MINETNNSMQDTTQAKKTYKVNEIAGMLDISMKSAYKLINSGQFSYIKTGHIIRVSKESFDKWLHQ